MAHWGMLVDLRRCAGCYACVVACQMHNNLRPGIAWSAVDCCEWSDGETPHRAYLPHGCMQCVDAPCVEVCPTGASAQRDDGIVTAAYDQCIGCGACVDVCPHGARVLSNEEAWHFGESEPAPYEAEAPRKVGVAEKCIFCCDRVDQGLQPACVYGCPGSARIFGDLDDPASDISQALAAAGDAACTVPGTSFYYIPFSTMPASMLPGAIIEGGR